MKPNGYDDAVAKHRHVYSSPLHGDVVRVLQTRYPKSANEMSPVVMGFYRRMIAELAGSYREPPDRVITDDKNHAISDDAPAAIAFASMLRASNILSVMPELERRLLGPRLAYLKVGVRNDALRLQHYWPDDVDVIWHPSAIGDLQRAYACVFRMPGRRRGTFSYEAWTREVDGAPWRATLLDEDENEIELYPDGFPSPYLPCARFCVVDDLVYPSPDMDLIHNQDTINAYATDAVFVDKMQGHSQLVYAGNQLGDKPIDLGPSRLARLGAGESLTSVPLGSGTDMFDHAETLMRLLAAMVRASPDAFSAEGPFAESGIAREIKNQPRSEARQELTPSLAATETQQLLPIMASVSDLWLGTRIGRQRYKITFAKPRVQEDPMQRTNRALAGLNAKLISPARAAYLCDFFDSIDEAVQRGGLVDEIDDGAIADDDEPLDGSETVNFNGEQVMIGGDNGD